MTHWICLSLFRKICLGCRDVLQPTRLASYCSSVASYCPKHAATLAGHLADNMNLNFSAMERQYKQIQWTRIPVQFMYLSKRGSPSKSLISIHHLPQQHKSFPSTLDSGDHQSISRDPFTFVSSETVARDLILTIAPGCPLSQYSTHQDQTNTTFVAIHAEEALDPL